jgi:hypothetical protein
MALLDEGLRRRAGLATEQEIAPGIVGEPVVVAGQIIGWSIGGEFFTQEEVDSLIATGKFPEEPKTGGGTGRTQFPSEQERDLASAELARAQAKNLVTPEERALAEQNRMREARLDAARALAQSKIAERTELRKTAAGMAGEDAFRSTALLRGKALAPGTRTPFDIFKGQMREAIDEPIPLLSSEMGIQALDSAIAKLQGSQAPTAPVFGLAGGTPGAGVGILVGENDDGSLNPTTEVMELDRATGRVKSVIPLVSRAAKGVDFDLPFDLGGFEDLFGSLRESAGLPSTLYRGQPALGTTAQRTTRSRLGVAPAGGGELSTTPAPFQALGDTIGIRRGLIEAGMDPMEAIPLSNRIGLLPAPHKVAPFILSLSPLEQKVMMSAYELAGIDRFTLRDMMQKSLVGEGSPTAVTALA